MTSLLTGSNISGGTTASLNVNVSSKYTFADSVNRSIALIWKSYLNSLLYIHNTINNTSGTVTSIPQQFTTAQGVQQSLKILLILARKSVNYLQNEYKMNPYFASTKSNAVSIIYGSIAGKISNGGMSTESQLQKYFNLLVNPPVPEITQPIILGEN